MIKTLLTTILLTTVIQITTAQRTLFLEYSFMLKNTDVLVGKMNVYFHEGN